VLSQTRGTPFHASRRLGKSERRYLKSQVGKVQLLTPEESMNYLKESFGIEIID
jgi:hypothetical protein